MKKIYSIIRPHALTFLLIIAGILFLSFNYRTEASAHSPGHNDEVYKIYLSSLSEQDDDGPEQLTNTDDDHRKRSRTFIRTRGTLKSIFKKNFTCTTQEYTSFPPAVLSMPVATEPAAVLKPAYYNFLFRYTLF